MAHRSSGGHKGVHARVSPGYAGREARGDRSYMVEMVGQPFLYLAQAADGAVIWTSDHDQARQFDDAADAAAFAGQHVAAAVRIIGRRGRRKA